MEAGTEQEKRDAQTLMNVLMNQVQEQLRREGAFLPAAASLDRAGLAAIVPSAASAPPEDAAGLVQRLRATLRTRAAAGKLCAGAIAADVRFGERGSDERRDAVQLHIEHERGYCVDIYLPYRRRRRSTWWPRRRAAAEWRVHFSHPVAQEGTPTIWPEIERLR